MLGMFARVFPLSTVSFALLFFTPLTLSTLADDDSDDSAAILGAAVYAPLLNMPITSAEPSEYDAPIAVYQADGELTDGVKYYGGDDPYDYLGHSPSS